MVAEDHRNLWNLTMKTFKTFLGVTDEKLVVLGFYKKFFSEANVVCCVLLFGDQIWISKNKR